MLRHSRWFDLLGLTTLGLVVVGLYMAFLYAQTEVNMGLVYRIFFFHFGAVAAGMSASIVTGIASIGYLRTASHAWDRVAEASAEVGVVFSLIGLVTGSIWARPIWGVWWTWDPRLTTFLIMWLIYLAYLMLRASARDDPRVARFAAVYGILAMVNVPIVSMSARVWRGISPVIFRQTEQQQFSFGLTPEMLQTLVVCIVAHLFLFALLVAYRARLEALREELVTLRRALASK